MANWIEANTNRLLKYTLASAVSSSRSEQKEADGPVAAQTIRVVEVAPLASFVSAADDCTLGQVAARVVREQTHRLARKVHLGQAET